MELRGLALFKRVALLGGMDKQDYRDSSCLIKALEGFLPNKNSTKEKGELRSSQEEHNAPANGHTTERTATPSMKTTDCTTRMLDKLLSLGVPNLAGSPKAKGFLADGSILLYG
ncbi:hypothetical protein M9H77_12826 [Catharanthus roseus]|uniref:Uncharacterized protein n=1 Tax=Catharanthus roseus TaxID=4058 RepID=A0ACC0BIP7_CATRO|nr:hypothetical protein M9H77_12826 [Catharanthus roseus]